MSASGAQVAAAGGLGLDSGGAGVLSHCPKLRRYHFLISFDIKICYHLGMKTKHARTLTAI
ncbi:hypothetical protein, partial [Burkholderia multivorans]|uniref:hypothetical protein n=1 Tax=Burkholderia multivorans TaxID=87883 RepID=UPI001C613DC5